MRPALHIYAYALCMWVLSVWKLLSTVQAFTLPVYLHPESREHPEMDHVAHPLAIQIGEFELRPVRHVYAHAPGVYAWIEWWAAALCCAAIHSQCTHTLCIATPTIPQGISDLTKHGIRNVRQYAYAYMHIYACTRMTTLNGALSTTAVNCSKHQDHDSHH